MEDFGNAADETVVKGSGSEKTLHRVSIANSGYSCRTVHGSQLYAAIQQGVKEVNGENHGADGDVLDVPGNAGDIKSEGSLKIIGPCGGRGLCGKCRVKVLSGRTEPPNEIEAGHLSRQELDDGIRLACMLRVVDDLLISILSAHDELTNCTGTVRTTFWGGKTLCGTESKKLQADGTEESETESEAKGTAKGEWDGNANDVVNYEANDEVNDEANNEANDEVGSKVNRANCSGAFVKEHRVKLTVPTMDDRRDLLSRLKASLEDPLEAQREGTLRASQRDASAYAKKFAEEFVFLPGDMQTASNWLCYWMDKMQRAEADQFGVSVFTCEERIAGAVRRLGAAESSADPGKRYFGVAADVGTTTIAVYLTDMESGKILDVSSALNAQAEVGADVITRISCTLESEGGLGYQQKLILEQLQGLIQGMIRKQGISSNELLGCTVTGNSTMMHLLAGIDPVSIARFPYVPVFTQPLVFPGAFFTDSPAGGKNRSDDSSGPAASTAASKAAAKTARALEASEASKEGLLFPGLPHCSVLVMPGVSAYIGPDIAAGIVACGMDMSDKPALFVDIGTNGEMVLGDASGLYGCAAAAGPAFEGAVLSCGSGGVPGAIDRVFADGEELHFTTIQGAFARSICGSGVVDIIAVLLNRGLIDARGKFTTPSLSAGDFTKLKNRRRRIGGKEAFVLVPEDVDVENVSEKKSTFTFSENVENVSEKKSTFTFSEKPVYITQQDIRELQLAKAAIAVGIDALIRDSGISLGEVDKLIVAGGFGSSMDPENALRIGLFPYEFAGRVVSAGNMAGRGALDALMDGSVRNRCEKVRDNFTLVELAASASFQRELMKHMYFSE